PSRNEEEYFARRDAELLRQQRTSAQQAAAQAERRSHHMKCPKCGYDLITGEWHGIQIDQCTHRHGLWFDAGEAESLIAHPQPNMIARVFRAVLRGVSGAKASDASSRVRSPATPRPRRSPFANPPPRTLHPVASPRSWGGRSRY